MPASPRPSSRRRHRARRPQIVPCAGLVPIAAAREIVDEVSRWLGVQLPARYAAGLAFRAHRCFAHSPSFREKVMRPGDAGRDKLWMFLRHWLAARLHAEHYELYRRLPPDYACGADLPPRTPVESSSSNSPDIARLTDRCW